MRIARKVYMSIFTTLFILITCVATTFAWVGMFTTATLGSFDLNIKTVDIDSDYFLKISADDEIYTSSKTGSTFGDTANLIKVKRQILENMGHNTTLYLDDAIDQLFAAKAVMEPVTTDPNLSEFYAMVDLKTKKPYLSKDKRYFKFDIYLSVDTKNGISSMAQEELDALNINANVFFENIVDALVGTDSTGSLINTDLFSTIPSGSPYSVLSSIDYRKITVNTKNATRVAFQVYNPIEITSHYTGLETPIDTIIYQGGKQLPSINNGIYDLGGILPEEYNLALKEINKIYNINIDLDSLNVDQNSDGSISDDEKIGYNGAKLRYDNQTDLEMVETNNKIWLAPTTISGLNYLGVANGVQTKMKLSVYFWYEGYDADCLRLIDFKPTSLNISLSTDKKIN